MTREDSAPTSTNVEIELVARRQRAQRKRARATLAPVVEATARR